jgi:ubiquinone biosynthesis protein COQ9
MVEQEPPMTALLDMTTPHGRLIAAALKLADTRPWAEITLLDIADAAGLQLADLKRTFGSKTELVTAFMTAVDDAVVRQAPKRDGSQPVRDTLFEVIMGRFDILQPYKAAMKSIFFATAADPSLVRPFFASQHWMLQAAGIGTDGGQGTLRILGLGSLYAAVFRTWLSDDDPGMARTMASLDRRLRRGEQTINTIEDTCSGMMRFASTLPDLAGRVFGRGRQARDDATPPASGPYG